MIFTNNMEMCLGTRLANYGTGAPIVEVVGNTGSVLHFMSS